MRRGSWRHGRAALRTPALLVALLVASAACADGGQVATGLRETAEPSPQATPAEPSPTPEATSTPGPTPEPGPGGTPAPTPPPSPDPAAGEAVNAFGFDLHPQLSPEAGNVISSPVSAALLLGMVLAGAEGDTQQAVADVLHLPGADEGRPEERYAGLLAALDGVEDVTLAVGNALWLNEGHRFRDAYREDARSIFDAEIDELDLGSPEAVEIIDAWVADRTEGLIEELAEDLGVPDAGLVLVLANAVYFFGEWTEPFDPERTEDGEFRRADGSTVTVPFMTRTDEYEHAERDGYEVVRLPYGEEERFGMEVFVPDEGETVEDLVADMTAERWAEDVDALTAQRLRLALPRFELSYETDLDEALRALGMGIVYDARAADFSRMSPANPFLSTVVQKTHIEVDEEGTEAAAATGGGMPTSMPPEVRADRPFLFTVSDQATGTILFLGTVGDPTG